MNLALPVDTLNCQLRARAAGPSAIRNRAGDVSPVKLSTPVEQESHARSVVFRILLGSNVVPEGPREPNEIRFLDNLAGPHCAGDIIARTALRSVGVRM